MFETAELGHEIAKADYSAHVPALRKALLDAQSACVAAKAFPIVLVIGGVDGAGKGEIAQLLNTWLDPHDLEANAFGLPSDTEKSFPRMRRFWQVLPPKGKMGIFFGSWYTSPILDRVKRKLNEAEFDHALAEIRHFEQMLVDEGALVVKFWLHLSKRAQKHRLKTLAADPLRAWRVTAQDWKRFKHYDKFRAISTKMVRETSTGKAPWIVVEGTDARYRSLTVGRALLDAMQQRLAQQPLPIAPLPAQAPQVDAVTVLASVDLSQRLAKSEYEAQLLELQADLARLCRSERFGRRGLVAVFEGWDAAGKGGAIRHVTEALDPRHYRINGVAAPSEDERAQPYLWRFWRKLPPTGHVAVFDRSWYGRVLVERVEGFCAPADWQRAYAEINDFEEQMTDHGLIVCKFWLHISPAEQLRRFEARQTTDFKQFKLTQDDWRNRDKQPAYSAAVHEMVERTSSEIAPWTLIAAEDKYFSRIAVLKELVRRLS